MLLTRAENGPQGKTDIAPDEWFAEKDASYLDLHLIPTDREPGSSNDSRSSSRPGRR